jgi:hypothetical protein
MLSPNSLIAILKTADPALKQACLIDGTNEGVTWLPLLEYKGKHVYGLTTETGTWASEYADRKRITSPNHFSGFLMLLESPFREVVNLLTEAVVRAQMPAVVARTFPMDQLIEAGLSSPSYWSSLAEGWLDSGYPPNDRIAELAPRSRTVLDWRRCRQSAIFGEEP